MPEQSFTAKVVSVSNEFCAVDNDGYVYHEVRLRATIDGNSNQVILFPKVGSWVMVSRIMDEDDFFVSMVSEVERVVMSIDGKFMIKNVSIGFKDLLNDFVAEIEGAVIQTPAGAGSMAPITVQKLEAIKNKINQLFE